VSLGPLPTALLALPLGIAATGLLVLGTDRVVYKLLPRAEGQADHLRHRLDRGDVHHQRHRALHHRRG
jgi:hypothetical protein